MKQKTKNQESREQKNQKLMATIKEALEMQKAKSNHLLVGKVPPLTLNIWINYTQKVVQLLVALLTWRKPAVYQDPKLLNTFSRKPLTQNTNNSVKLFPDWKLLHTE